jgi:hypothetical protein
MTICAHVVRGDRRRRTPDYPPPCGEARRRRGDPGTRAWVLARGRAARARGLCRSATPRARPRAFAAPLSGGCSRPVGESPDRGWVERAIWDLLSGRYPGTGLIRTKSWVKWMQRHLKLTPVGNLPAKLSSIEDAIGADAAAGGGPGAGVRCYRRRHAIHDAGGRGPGPRPRRMQGQG